MINKQVPVSDDGKFPVTFHRLKVLVDAGEMSADDQTQYELGLSIPDSSGKLNVTFPILAFATVNQIIAPDFRAPTIGGVTLNVVLIPKD